jgi:hypothetical protein
MIDKTITGDTFTQSQLNDCRRIGVWSNAKDQANTIISSTTVFRSDINTESGSVIYVDNRLPIFRYTNQTEEYKILVGF